MMNKRRAVLLFVSHAIAVGVGFAAGIYVLPLLIAPPSPTTEQTPPDWTPINWIGQ